MILWPADSEIIESRYSADEIYRRLTLVVRQVKFQSVENKENQEEISTFLFNGIVKKESFSISKTVKRPNNFLPVLNGKLEVIDEDLCLIHLSYTLFPIVKYFVGFWILLMLLLALVFYNENREWYYVILPFIILCGTYFLMRNRYMQARKMSRKELLRLLT